MFSYLRKYSFLLFFMFSLAVISKSIFAGEECGNENAAISASTPNTDFIIHNDGTVTHIPTGLMWMRCTVGQNWNGTSCSSNDTPSNKLSWRNALEQNGNNFAGYTDWRLPSVTEMHSIVEYRCWAPSINSYVFPNTPTGKFWSSSSLDDFGLYAWNVDFQEGNAGFEEKELPSHARLVRSVLR